MHSIVDPDETVRYVQDRRNQFFGCGTALVASGCFWLWFKSGEMEASLGVILFAFLALVAWKRLDPEKCYLLLTYDGFEENLPIGKPVRRTWREVAEFRVVQEQNGTESVAYQLVGSSNRSSIDGKLGDSYGMPSQDLARILNSRLRRNIHSAAHTPVTSDGNSRNLCLVEGANGSSPSVP